MDPTIEEALVSEWTTAVEALDTDSIQELFDIQPSLLWTPLSPLGHLETDFAHFIRRLKEHKILGTSIRPVYALHHILYDYGVPDDEWAPERIELVEFILKNTKGNELNTCFWGEEENTVMHLAYFIQQPELIQQLKEHGALETITNKLDHLPTIQPQVKLLISKPAPKERVLATNNASDRFKRLRELAESPNLNKPTTERQNSTRRYFQPGHLEERRRRVLSEEEQAELDKKNLLRQKEVDQLAQRSAVKNNPLFKKFEEERLLKDQKQAKRTPSITAASAVRDRKKLLGAADQIRRTSRVINSLKDRSYVTTSVFRQTQETEPTVHHTGNTLHVPTLAQLRAGTPSPNLSPSVSPSVSPNASPHTIETPKKIEETKVEAIVTPKETDTVINVADRLIDDKKTYEKKQENSASNNDKRGVTDEELESLSVGRLGERELNNQSKKTKKEIDIASNKVKDIVNVHERLFDENDVEIVPIGKKFAVWKKEDEDSGTNSDDSSSSVKRVPKETTSDKQSLDDKANRLELKQKEGSLEQTEASPKQKLENLSSSINATPLEKQTSSEEKAKLTKPSTVAKEPPKESFVVKGRVLLVDEQAALDGQNSSVPVKEKTEYSYQYKNVPKDEPVTVVDTVTEDYKPVGGDQLKDTEKTRAVSDNKPAVVITPNDYNHQSKETENKRSLSDNTPVAPSIVSASVSALNDRQANDILNSKLSEKEASRSIFSDTSIASGHVPKSVTDNATLGNNSKDTEKPQSISTAKVATSGVIGAVAINELISSDTCSSTDSDSSVIVDTPVDGKSVSGTIQMQNSLDQINDISPKENSELDVVFMTDTTRSTISPLNNQLNASTNDRNTFTPLFDDDINAPEDIPGHTSEDDDMVTSSFLDDLTFEDNIVPSMRAEDTSNQQPKLIVENETSPIPTLTNQIESNHEKLSRTMVEVEPTPQYEDTSSDEDDYTDTTHTQYIDKGSKSTDTLYANTFNSLGPNHPKEEEASRVLHLEINTNKSQMMIEEESDEDEATTPTLANPYHKKMMAEEESSSSDDEDDESRQEWQSAYNGLVADQQQLEFEDDVLQQQQRRQLRGRESISSDLDETSILQTLSYQNENRVSKWGSKRQSGSQRNHWSVGMQDATMKRESMLSKNESIAASSEAGSEQWFDPEETWNEQEELRRQSMLVSGFHAAALEEETYDDDYYYRHSGSSINTNSETYSYKNSNSTENTALDEDEDEDERKQNDLYRQEILEEEDDYYSTNLHTVNNASKTRGESSYYHGGQTDNEQEEGEIVVFMDQFSSPPEPVSTRQMQSGQASEGITTSFYNNSSSTTHIIEQQKPVTITNFSTSTLSVNNQRDDDEISLIKVPSRTVAIAEAGSKQEYVPHDPNNPRVEDISHYMNKLPTFEKGNTDTAVHGGSAFDTSADIVSDNEPTVVKRAISTSQQNGQPLEQSRGIPNAHEINTEFSMFMDKRASNEDHPYKVSMSSIDTSRFGKMYIGVSGAHNMLLPLPKEITYVRCVISDGEYEYMSRYEILAPQILMDYECIIDTKPGMIITVSLHVRPDYHVKPRTGWSRWFTSIRKQKEHLSGYVHPEDGAIGQTRFAVDHMVPGCHKKTYEAHFDCFNSWYARTNRERARREQFGDDEDFLKIVGKLNVEMLYLPVSNPSPVPRSLRECDLTLKIRQWHDTCWQSGYLSTRRQGLKIWERHYYRLIGSQLIGYTSDGLDRQVWDHYNMSDVLQLSAAADKVIVTLLEDDEKVFSQESIHAENHKGFFRLAFPDYHLDCVSDDLEESEEWVKTLKSMIGRVPLRLPFSD
ncbi:hypothetical protein INT48_006338 [Thamnidium elegans]|uniref:PH domain-containing protein n=1 Tax=Thamnidium elegans TaxID=101142 RepID=A0A8H7VRU8_9FUNG|nr:hypothetical protein INT48_006338 [Thamnidium elegans]